MGQAQWCSVEGRGGQRSESIGWGLAEVKRPKPCGEAIGQEQEKEEEMVIEMGGTKRRAAVSGS